jgi:hypothetical protein
MMMRSRISALERQLSAHGVACCPRCCPIPFYEVRRREDGELVQLNGSALPPLCACGGERSEIIRQILVVRPDRTLEG